METQFKRLNVARIIEIDMSEYEARISEEALEHRAKFYEHVGLTQQQADLFRLQKEQVGRTRSGVKWKRTAGMASGVPDTSLGNSLSTAEATNSYFIQEDYDLEQHMGLMVLGDDNFIIVDHDMWDKMDHSTLKLQTWLENLNWKPEIKDYAPEDLPKAEYCSGWFCRYEHEGEMKLTWTPKTGKVLAKTLFIKPQDRIGRNTIKGICMGLTAGPCCPLLYTALNGLKKTIRSPTGKGITPKFDRVYEWQPYATKKIGQVKMCIEDVCVRYGLSTKQYFEVRDYLADQVRSGQWPINLSTQECVPFGVIYAQDVAQSETGVISLNLTQRNPNLTNIDRVDILNPPEYRDA